MAERRAFAKQLGRLGLGAGAAALALLAGCDRAAPPAAEPLPAADPAPIVLPGPASQPAAPPQTIAESPIPPAAPAPPPPPPRPIDEAFVMTCDGPFSSRTTLADLRSRFGAENVAEDQILGVEGDALDGAVLFPDDPARRMEIVWADVAAKQGVASALVYDEESVWSGPGGLRIGADLAAVEAVNGGSFILYGFEWDFGGVVSDWLDGSLTQEANGQICNVQVRFGVIDTIDPELALSVAGDAPFGSDDERMRGAGPVVRQLGIGFASAG